MLWLALCGLLMLGIFFFEFTARYSLAEFGTTPHGTVASLGNLSADSAFGYVADFAGRVGLYWLAMRLVSRRGLRLPSRRQWLLVGGFAFLFNAALLPMYPIDAADIYDYIIRGRMSSVYGLNPMAVTPNKVSDDPFYQFAAWTNVTLGYGPGWEMIAAVTSRIAGDDPTVNVIAFKLLAVICYLLDVVLVGLILREIAPKRMLLGVLLFAWNPLGLFMTAGVGHNDSVMVLLMALSVYCLVRRWYVGATLAAVLGALVKFIPILILPIIALVALRELTTSGRLRYLVVSGIATVMLTVVIFAPYWTGLDALGLDRRAGMYTGSVATLARQTLGYVFDGHSGESVDTPQTNNILKYVVLGLLGLFVLDRCVHVLRASRTEDPLYAVRAMLAILLFYLLVSCIWFQSWYVIWVLVFAPLLDNTPMRPLPLLLSYLVTWQTFLYNYVTLRPDGWAPLPWRDLVPVAIVMGSASLYVALYWLSHWWRSGTRKPLLIATGARLRAAREAAKLIPANPADELELRTDDLLGYESGEIAIPLDRAETLSERLGLSLPELVSPTASS